MQTVSDNPFVFRPGFTLEERFLKSPRENEKRLLPFAMLPQIITGDFSTPHKCSFSLEYSINETVGAKVKLGEHIMLDVGKFSQKVLAVTVTYKNRDDFFQTLTKFQAYLEMRQLKGKDAIQHYFGLLARIFDQIIADLERQHQF